MQLFAFNLENFTLDRFFYTGTARGARDKYEVCDGYQLFQLAYLSDGLTQMLTPFLCIRTSPKHAMHSMY